MADLNHDIEKYLNGQLSPAEMHALEKRALNDPFLADALEGAGAINAMDRSADLNELDIRLTERQKRQINWKVPLRIAATLALITAVSYGVYRFALPTTSDDDIALRKTEQQPAAVDTAMSQNMPKEDMKSAAPPSKELSELKKESEPASPVAGPGEAPRSEAENSPELADQSHDQSAERPASIEQQKEQPTTADDALASQPTKDEAAVDKSAAAGRRLGLNEADNHVVLKGKVTEAGSGNPLPGVNVIASGSASGAVSDSNGDYQVILDSKPTSLVFSSLGYQTKEVHIAATESKLNVEMPAEASQLNEVVVMSYSKNNDEALSDEPIQLAQPIGGRRAYDNYLESSLRYPPVAYEKKIEGRVTLEFTVQANGALSDFVVVHGLDGGCNEEVIRLVKEGPAWKPSTQGSVALRSTLRLRVKFKL